MSLFHSAVELLLEKYFMATFVRYLLCLWLLMQKELTATDVYGKWTGKFEQVLSLYMRTFGDTVKDNLKDHTNLDLNLATRENILLIMKSTTARYGSWTTEEGEAKFEEMKAIPHFTSVMTKNLGLKLYKDLLEERDTWHVRHQFDDSSSRSWLLERISARSIFSHL